MKNRLLASFALAAAIGLGACSEEEATRASFEPALAQSNNPELVECPSDVTYSTSGSVLATGGAVSLRGHRVSVPTGAVLTPTEIGLSEPASKFIQIGLSANGQEHFQFGAPLTITISYARCSRANIDKGPLSVWLIDETTGALLQNMGGVDDKVNRSITFQTDHFSGYAIAN